MPPVKKHKSEDLHLDTDGRFVIRNYHRAKPFSSFFPGIAGLWGIPMWVFYVNRGQAISSFGIESKDKAVLEFLPANKAYRQTSLQGFRTFIKVTRGRTATLWEPFQGAGSGAVMSISGHDLMLTDEDRSLGLKVVVNYFTLPNEPFPALVRRVTFINLSRKTLDLQVVDGLPLIIPYGMRDWALKNMSRTVEAWVKVKNVEHRAPFYHLNVETDDSTDVKYIKEGHFYFSFLPSHKKAKLLAPIVESAVVFGQATDFSRPDAFAASARFKVPARQQTANRTPSAMCYLPLRLAAHARQEVVSFCGHTHSQQHLHDIVQAVTRPGYVDQKALENEKLITSVKDYALTKSSSPEFDLYCGQTFLDNVLRGGLAVTIDTADGKTAFNVYSRKHGDPERDYNYFVLSATNFSQGNGNYRDVNQNRRNDMWFNPDVKDSSVIDFLNLSQADGFNPLVVKAVTFSLRDPEHLQGILLDEVKGEHGPLREILSKSFQPGEVLRCVHEHKLQLRHSPQEFLRVLLSHCQRQILADHAEGFWTDHWTYNLDLVERYLAIYPEHLKDLFVGKALFSFYHNSHYTVGREDRYLLTEKGVRQHHAVVDGSKEIRANERGNKLRVDQGQGDVYYTTLFVKLLCLITNKAASLDPSGIGIEMEADKPNWYDAFNGLPALLGSSTCESIELKRLAMFLVQSIDTLRLKDHKVPVYVELADFITELAAALEAEKDPAAFWHKANDAKEHYRKRVRQGIAGQEATVPVSAIRIFLKAIIDRVRHGLDKAKDPDGMLVTYLYHEVTDYALLDKKSKNYSHVLPVAFKRHDLPLYLEGFVHALRVNPDPALARDLYQRLRKSGLFDRKLKMYKVNADISGVTDEVGRARIFPPGWLENESIWLHMHYKYLLELLRNGLFEEFYKDFQDVLIPFLDPQVYGRSILENSSFLASSAHEDDNLHGQGFVARLSGSTAEFLHMWLLMNTGPQPFRWEGDRGLILRFQPALPGWLFTKTQERISLTDRRGKEKAFSLPANTYAFHFLGATLVVYHNPRRRDTFGPRAAKIKEISLTYPDSQKSKTITGGEITADDAQAVRAGEVERIDVLWE